MVNASINLRAACLNPLKSGFDPDGAEQLKGKLVGHNKWIGTAGKNYIKICLNRLIYALKSCMWHSRIEESRNYRPSPFETRIRVSLQLTQIPTYRF
jgi:hypothetical protein